MKSEANGGLGRNGGLPEGRTREALEGRRLPRELYNFYNMDQYQTSPHDLYNMDQYETSPQNFYEKDQYQTSPHNLYKTDQYQTSPHNLYEKDQYETSPHNLYNMDQYETSSLEEARHKDFDIWLQDFEEQVSSEFTFSPPWQIKEIF